MAVWDPTNLITVDGREYTLAELRDNICDEVVPEFTRKSRGGFYGADRDVILADRDGSHPQATNAEIRYGKMTLLYWKRSRYVWILTDGQSRYIVAGKGHNGYGAQAYQRWQGVSLGFEENNFAFPVRKTKKEDSLACHSTPVAREKANTGDRSSTQGSDRLDARFMHTAAGHDVSASQRNTSNQVLSSAINSKDRRYDISEILQSDRAHYGTIKPPFVHCRKSRSRMSLQGPIIAVLLDKNGGATQDKLQIHRKPYDTLYMYYTVTIRNTPYLVKPIRWGQHGTHYSIWYGHADACGPDSIALPSQYEGAATKESVSSKAQRTGNALHPSRNTTSTSPDPTACSVTVSFPQEQFFLRLPRKDTEEVPEGRTGTASTDQWIAQIRRFYSHSKPEFVRDKGNYKPYDTKWIRQGPQHRTRRSSLLTCHEWDQNTVFWTASIGDFQYMVSSFDVNGRVAWQWWQGHLRGFSERVVGYEKAIRRRNESLTSADLMDDTDEIEDGFRAEALTSDSEDFNEDFQTPPSEIPLQTSRPRPSLSSEEDEEPRPPKIRKRDVDTALLETDISNLDAASSGPTDFTINVPIIKTEDSHIEPAASSSPPPHVQPKMPAHTVGLTNHDVLVTKTEDSQLEPGVPSLPPPHRQPKLPVQTIDLTNDDSDEQPPTQAQPTSALRRSRVKVEDIEDEDLDNLERETRQNLIELYQENLMDILERKARLAILRDQAAAKVKKEE
ncbi:MAG: hypothetical protein Q9174_003211 [Haloplaca sp. 1 TL-2023]